VVFGTTTAISYFNDDQPVYAAAPTEDSARVQALADAVFSSFNGSRPERDAGAVLEAYALNGGLSRCMEQAGFANWDWSLPRAKNPTSHGLGTSVFFGPPLAQEHTTALLESAPSIKADQRARTLDLTPSQDEQVTVCLPTIRSTPEDEALNSPLEASRLRELWWQMIDELDATHGDLDEYSKCIAASSVDGLPDGVATADDAANALYGLRPESSNLPESRQDPLTASGEWLSLVQAEAAWDAVDWGCRGETYNRELEAVASAVQDFSETYAEEIDTARRQWEEISRGAAALGYDGTYGPVRESDPDS